MELEIVTEPQETIIEPVIRNQYLQKLKRLLPTFFDEFNREEMQAILAKHQNSEAAKLENEDLGLELLNNIEKYSTKIHKIIENINNSKGKEIFHNLLIRNKRIKIFFI